MSTTPSEHPQFLDPSLKHPLHSAQSLEAQTSNLLKPVRICKNLRLIHKLILTN